MIGLSFQTNTLAKEGRAIQVGLIGAGQMGTDIVSQISMMPSQRLIIVADTNVQRAVDSYQIAGYAREQVRVAESLEEAAHYVDGGDFVAAGDLALVTDSAPVEAVIEATGIPEVSARAALRTIYNRKHLVTMSVEMDITVGLLLSWYARQRGVVYAIGAGDEPVALYELFDFATSLGLTIVAAGKGKNNPLNRSATPDDLAETAVQRGLTPEMLVEFVDGSKTMIEMASVANATGLLPDVFGMHGPHINIDQFKSTFALKTEGGILNRIGVVDYVIGDLAPGVFLVFTTEKERLKQALILRDMGTGPNYVLIRPFHLCSMEVPLSVAYAVLQGKSTMAPRAQVAEVVSVAKRDLMPGDRLERIGGRTHYGMVTTAATAADEQWLPIGIAKDCMVVEPVKAGDVIRSSSVTLPNTMIATLRRLQDDWLANRLEPDAVLMELNRLANESV